MNYLIFSLALLMGNIDHAGHTAEYHYQYDGAYVNLKFLIEKGELMSFEFGDECNFKDMTALCALNYINQHSFIMINGEKLEMELQNSFTEHDHLIIHARAAFSSESISEITIENQCFYEFDEEFKNRIVLDIARFQKSYLLNSTKNSLQLE